MSLGAAGPKARRTDVDDYFFTHLLVPSSHFIVEIFSHAALVFGAPLAMAGAATPKATAARMMVLSSFLDMWKSPSLVWVLDDHPAPKLRRHSCGHLTPSIRFCKEW